MSFKLIPPKAFTERLASLVVAPIDPPKATVLFPASIVKFLNPSIVDPKLIVLSVDVKVVSAIKVTGPIKLIIPWVVIDPPKLLSCKTITWVAFMVTPSAKVKVLNVALSKVADAPVAIVISPRLGQFGQFNEPPCTLIFPKDLIVFGKDKSPSETVKFKGIKFGL